MAINRLQVVHARKTTITTKIHRLFSKLFFCSPKKVNLKIFHANLEPFTFAPRAWYDTSQLQLPWLNYLKASDRSLTKLPQTTTTTHEKPLSTNPKIPGVEWSSHHQLGPLVFFMACCFCLAPKTRHLSSSCSPARFQTKDSKRHHPQRPWVPIFLRKWFLQVCYEGLATFMKNVCKARPTQNPHSQRCFTNRQFLKKCRQHPGRPCHNPSTIFSAQHQQNTTPQHVKPSPAWWGSYLHQVVMRSMLRPPQKTNKAMEKQPVWKMYLPLKMVFLRLLVVSTKLKNMSQNGFIFPK